MIWKTEQNDQKETEPYIYSEVPTHNSAKKYLAEGQ